MPDPETTTPAGADAATAPASDPTAPVQTAPPANEQHGNREPQRDNRNDRPGRRPQPGRPPAGRPQRQKPPVETPESEQQPEAAETDSATPVSVDIMLKQPRQVGDVQFAAGDKLATVVLEPHVSIGYLARAVHDDVAGPAAS